MQKLKEKFPETVLGEMPCYFLFLCNLYKSNLFQTTLFKKNTQYHSLN